MTDKELKEIKDRVDKAASVEEWGNTDSSMNYPFSLHLKRPRKSLSHDEGEGTKKEQRMREHYLYHCYDGIFILNAKRDMLKLIEEIERLRK